MSNGARAECHAPPHHLGERVMVSALLVSSEMVQAMPPLLDEFARC